MAHSSRDGQISHPGLPVLLSATAWSRDGFIVRVSADGTVERAVAVGGPEDDDLRAVATAPEASPWHADGSYVAVGSFHAATDMLVSAGGSDIVVAAFRANGSLEWARRYGGAQTTAALPWGTGRILLKTDLWWADRLRAARTLARRPSKAQGR